MCNESALSMCVSARVCSWLCLEPQTASQQFLCWEDADCSCLADGASPVPRGAALGAMFRSNILNSC